MERFWNQVAVVTGSGSGIGAAVSKELLKYIGIIVIGLDIKEDKLKALSDEIEKNSLGRFRWRVCDVRVESQVKEIFDWICNDVGELAILVNCAGVLIQTTLLDATVSDIKETFDTNVTGLLMCAREAMNVMTKQYMCTRGQCGHIININSINGHYIRNRPDISKTMIYAASKHAVTVLSEGLRKEIKKRKMLIKCTNISPGHVNTEMTVSKDNPPIPNECIEPEDVAKACITVLNTGPNVLISELMIMGIYQEI